MSGWEACVGGCSRGARSLLLGADPIMRATGGTAIALVLGGPSSEAAASPDILSGNRPRWRILERDFRLQRAQGAR